MLLGVASAVRHAIPRHLDGDLGAKPDHVPSLGKPGRVPALGAMFLTNTVLCALVLSAALAPTPQKEIPLIGGGVCKSLETCERNSDLGPMVDEMIAEQVAHFGPTCVDPTKFKGIPTRVLVRNARPRDLDTGVVRVVTLDEALAGAKAGRVFVLKACA